MLKYVCAKCGSPVEVKDEKVVRKCNCPADTGVTVDLTATVTGESKLA